MGKKSFKKGRRDGAAGSGKRGSVGAGSDPMDVDPPLALVEKIERNSLARQKVVLPSTVQKVKVPSIGAYIDATRTEHPEEAIRALKIPSLRGIVSTNDDPRICAHCSVPFPDGCLPEVASLHMPCGAMVCDDCLSAHRRICTSSPDLILMHVKTGAPWALYHYARATMNLKDGHLFLRLMELAADAGHPHACHSLSVGHGWNRDATSFPLRPAYMKFYDLPQNISLAAKYAERALVLAPDAYRESSVYIHKFLVALVKDGRLKEAKRLADHLLDFEMDGYAQNTLDWIDLKTFGPFYDQLATTGQAPSSLTNLFFLDQHNMSPEELRLADYDSGDGILRMTFTALKDLAQQFAKSSSPLLVGLGGLVGSMHHLMGLSVNRDLYRAIPTIMKDIAKVLSKVDPRAPVPLLDSEHFLLLMLTSVASHARTDHRDIQVGELDRNFRSITDAIINNPKLPAYIRALALVIQADSFCQLPYIKGTSYSSNCPREVVIRRKSFALCDHVNNNENCPLKALSARLVDDSARRLATLQGASRFGALEEIASIRFAHGDDSADSEERIEDIKILYRNTVGGTACDQCGKTVSKTLPTLLKCRRCCQAQFCSKECASLAWDTWHGRSCKKLGAFSVGDLVRMKGIGYDEGNGRIRNGFNAVITEKTQDGHWAVRVLRPSDDGAFETDIFKSNNLYHLRTLK